MEKNLEYYMKLPYTFTLTPIIDESGSYYFAKVLELDGCMSDGATKEEALSNLMDAMEGWLEVGIDHNDVIPEPTPVDEYSGKFTLRIPKSLHYKLTQKAQQEGVSLNQYALYKLSS